MNNIDLLRHSFAFAAVVAAGSFRGGAEGLGLSPPYVSQLISELESRLGRQLLYRSTRALSLTEAGERFLLHARAMARAFQARIDSARGQATQLTGRLRVTAPSVLAAPVHARFTAASSRATMHWLQA